MGNAVPREALANGADGPDPLPPAGVPLGPLPADGAGAVTPNPHVPGHYQPIPGQRIPASYKQDAEGSRLTHVGSSESMGHTPPDSPGSSARSPLMFTPQIPMVPIPKADEFGVGPYPPWRYDTQGFGERQQQEQGIPTLIQWSHGGHDVLVEGSWDNWSTRIPLQRAGKDFTIVKLLPSGVYQYKFIVNGEWRYSPDLPWIYDEMGNVNNVLDVQDYVPENLESVAGFEPPRSPDSSYDDPFPSPEDFSKEPPAVPPHLHLTLLNAPPNADTPGALPRPQHVILNHLYVEKGKTARSVLALGLTHRFRSKYVTVVLYKPLRK